MGKLNIAHHKSYHPYRRDNIEKVRRDEEEARLKELQQEGKMLLADAEARLDLLRSRAGTNAPSKRQIEKDEERRISQRTSTALLDSGHINFFEDLEHQSLITTSTRAGAKKVSEDSDKGIPLAPSEKDLKPWYSAKGKERMTDGADDDDDRRARDMNRKSHADPLTSINSQLATSQRSSTSNNWRPRRPPPAALTDGPDKAPSEREARLTRESSERQRALDLIRRKKREMQGSETPSTVRNGAYGDMYNKADVEEAHRHKEKRLEGGNRRW